VDRYAASQAMAPVTAGTIRLAFYGAHLRRPFVTVTRSWPDPEGWARGGVERSGGGDDGHDRPLEASRQTPLVAERDQEVRRWVAARERERAEELAPPELPPARRRGLERRRQPWSGVTVFVGDSEVPRETSRRSGPGAARGWAAMRFSRFQTLVWWGLNLRPG
jgi:hypothetical protein